VDAGQGTDLNGSQFNHPGEAFSRVVERFAEQRVAGRRRSPIDIGPRRRSSVRAEAKPSTECPADRETARVRFSHPPSLTFMAPDSPPSADPVVRCSSAPGPHPPSQIWKESSPRGGRGPASRPRPDCGYRCARVDN